MHTYDIALNFSYKRHKVFTEWCDLSTILL